MSVLAVASQALSSPSVDWFATVAGLAGGLALFLYGLRELTDALQRVAGDRLSTVLSRLTTNRVTGVVTGGVVTAVLQSSTVTTVVAVGFVGAGVLAAVPAISVVLGANVGTTVTAQIISFDISTWALVAVALGVFGVMVVRRWSVPGNALLGLGLVFLGMQIMTTSMRPLGEVSAVVDILARLDVALLGVLAGALYTVAVNSSTASTAIAITLASTDLITLEAGVAIVIGANIGTCLTAVLAAWGRSPAAKRVAGAHVAINLVGAAIWIGLIPVLADLVMRISDDDVARQVANAHTVFNLSVTVALLPVLGVLVAVLERIFPDPPPDTAEMTMASALDPGLLGSPALALTAARVELSRLANDLAAAIEPAIETALGGSWDELAALGRDDDVVDRRYEAIVDYLSKIGQADLGERQAEELFVVLSIADDLESLGDVHELHIVTLGRRRLERSVHLSDEAVERIRHLGDVVAQVVADLARAIGDNDPRRAEEVVLAKDRINTALAKAFVAQAGRLVDQGTRDLAPFALERDLLEATRRIYYFAKRAASTQMLGRVTESSVVHRDP